MRLMSSVIGEQPAMRRSRTWRDVSVIGLMKIVNRIIALRWQRNPSLTAVF